MHAGRPNQSRRHCWRKPTLKRFPGPVAKETVPGGPAVKQSGLRATFFASGRERPGRRANHKVKASRRSRNWGQDGLNWRATASESGEGDALIVGPPPWVFLRPWSRETMIISSLAAMAGQDSKAAAEGLAGELLTQVDERVSTRRLRGSMRIR